MKSEKRRVRFYVFRHCLGKEKNNPSNGYKNNARSFTLSNALYSQVGSKRRKHTYNSYKHL